MDLKPTDVIAGYSFDGTNISIPLAGIEGLTAAEANAATGDGRAVTHSLSKHIYAMFSALATKPTRMNATKAPITLAPGGNADGTIRESFTFVFDMAPQGFEVADEP